MARAIIIIISAAIICGVAIFGYLNPSYEEVRLSQWDNTVVENEPVIFQFSSLKIINIGPDNTVVVSDIYGSKLTCNAALSDHPALLRTKSINAELTKTNGLCKMTKSSVSSGHRLAKLIISAGFTIAVFLSTLMVFKFDASELAIVKKD